MNLRGQIRTLCLVTAPSHVLADCWGGYRWGCLGAVSCNYNYSGPAAKSQHCWVHPRPARTKLSWLTRGVCQVSPAAVLNIVWIMSAILFIKTRTGPPLPLQGPGLVSVWPVTTAVASELRDGTCHRSHCMQGYCSAAVPQINIINSDSDYHIFKTKYPSRSQQWSDAGSDGPCPGAWQNKLIYHRNFRILSISLRSKRLPPCRG